MTRALLVALTILLLPGAALAGMPSVQLSDVAAMRVDAISFFLAGLLVSAGFIQLLWNWLRHDFVRLPRLSYFKAVVIVGLWGLLFVVVLTMISGARELMTPGAWEKQGATYKLRNTSIEPTPADAEELATRLQKLERLRDLLEQFAVAHDGRYPTANEANQIAAERWQLPEPAGLQYVYVPGRTTRDGERPLAYEPTFYGDEPLVLCCDGSIRSRKIAEIQASLPAEAQP